MNTIKLILLLIGLALILLAVPLGSFLAHLWLALSDGMEVSLWTVIFDRCIFGVQLLGALSAAYGLSGAFRA